MAFPRPALKLGPLHVPRQRTCMYYVTYVLFVVAVVAFWLIVRSPFGQDAGRDQAERAARPIPRAEHRPFHLRRDPRAAIYRRPGRRALRAAAALRLPAAAGLAPVGRLHPDDVARRRGDDLRSAGRRDHLRDRQRHHLDDHAGLGDLPGRVLHRVRPRLSARASSARSPMRSRAAARRARTRTPRSLEHARRGGAVGVSD